jgi:hypothetical protein
VTRDEGDNPQLENQVVGAAQARTQAPEDLTSTVAAEWILTCPVSHDLIEVAAIGTLTPNRWLARCPSCRASHRIEVVPQPGARRLGTNGSHLSTNDLREFEVSTDPSTIVMGLAPEDASNFERFREGSAPKMISVMVDEAQSIPLWPFDEWFGLEMSDDLIGRLEAWQQQALPGMTPEQEDAWLIAGHALVGELRESFPGVKFTFKVNSRLDRDGQDLSG